MRLRAGLAASALMAVGIFAAPASAATTRVVDSTPAQLCLKGSGPYATVQAAVDAAAPGDTIIVCSGTYEEQVVVATDRLTLSSKDLHGATIAAPFGASATSAAVLVDGADQVRVTKFAIAGGSATGVRVTGAATGARLADLTVSAERFGVEFGVPFFGGGNDASGSSGPGDQGSGILQDSQIDARDGVFAGGGGGLGTVVNLTRNRIQASHGGVLVGAGARTDLAFSNQVTGGASSDVGIWLDAPAPANTLSANTVSGFSIGTFLEETTGSAVKRNVITGNDFGLAVLPTSSGNTMTANRVVANAFEDCSDSSLGAGTAGTANKWTSNLGPNSSPDAICA